MDSDSKGKGEDVVAQHRRWEQRRRQQLLRVQRWHEIAIEIRQ